MLTPTTSFGRILNGNLVVIGKLVVRRILLFTLVLITPSYSSANDKGFCHKLPGVWQGTSHIKIESHCVEFGSCHPSFLGIVRKLKGNNYSMSLMMNMNGKVAAITYPIKCVEGELKIPGASDFNMDVRCDTMNNCFASLSSDVALVDAIKQG